jgi:hypothetical protein
MQTTSGIKDPIAQFWIKQLIPKARTLHNERILSPETRDMQLQSKKLKGEARKDIKNQIIAEIEQELMDWLTKQPVHRYNKIPENSRTSLLQSAVISC